MRYRTLGLVGLAATVSSCSGNTSSGSVSFDESEDRLTNTTTLSGTVEARNAEETLVGRVVLACTLPAKELHFRVESYLAPESGDKLPPATLIEVEQRWGSVPISARWSVMVDGHASQSFNNFFDVNVTTFIGQMQAERRQLLEYVAQLDSVQPLKLQVLPNLDSLWLLRRTLEAAGLYRVEAFDDVPPGTVPPQAWKKGISFFRYCYLNGSVGVNSNDGVCRALAPLPPELARTAAQHDSLFNIVEPLRNRILAILKEENINNGEANSWMRTDLVALSAQYKAIADSLGLMDGATEPNASAALIGPDWVVQYKAQSGTNTIVMATSDMRRVFDRCTKP